MKKVHFDIESKLCISILASMGIVAIVKTINDRLGNENISSFCNIAGVVILLLAIILILQHFINIFCDELQRRNKK